MSKSTHFTRHPVYAQLLKLLDKEKKTNKAQNKRFKRRVSAEGNISTMKTPHRSQGRERWGVLLDSCRRIRKYATFQPRDRVVGCD